MTPFPTTLDDAPEKLIGFLYRGDTDAHCGANAGWHIVGFAGNQLLTHPTPPQATGEVKTLSKEELKPVLESLTVPHGSFDIQTWLTLINTIVPLLASIFAKKQPV